MLKYTLLVRDILTLIIHSLILDLALTKIGECVPYSKNSFQLSLQLGGGCKPYDSPSCLNYGQNTYIIEGEVVDLMVHPLFPIQILHQFT